MAIAAAILRSTSDWLERANGKISRVCNTVTFTAWPYRSLTKRRYNYVGRQGASHGVGPVAGSLGERGGLERGPRLTECGLGTGNVILGVAPVFSPAGRLVVAHPLAHRDLSPRRRHARPGILVIEEKDRLAATTGISVGLMPASGQTLGFAILADVCSDPEVGGDLPRGDVI
jgi:hypothetical protein